MKRFLIMGLLVFITYICGLAQANESDANLKNIPDVMFNQYNGSFFFYPSGDVPRFTQLQTYKVTYPNEKLSRLGYPEVAFVGHPDFVNWDGVYSGDFVVPKYAMFNNDYYLVTSLENSFAYDKITKVTLPEELVSIGYRSFKNASRLEEITIPACVNHFGMESFWGLSSLLSITIKNPIPPICEYEGSNSNKILVSNKSNSNSYTSEIFTGINPYCVLTVPYGSKWFYQHSPAFNKFYNIQEVPYDEIWNSFSSFPLNKYDNESLTFKLLKLGNLNAMIIGISGGNDYYSTFSIPSKLKLDGTEYDIIGISPNVFEKSYSIDTLELSDGLCFLSSESFKGCSAKKIVIPASLIFAGERAFAEMTNLEEVVAISPESCNIFEQYTERIFAPNMFEGLPLNAKLTIDSSDKNNCYYEPSSPWKIFNNVEESSFEMIKGEQELISYSYFDGKLQINNNHSAPTKILIYDITGAEVLNRIIDSTEEVNLNPGIYIAIQGNRSTKIYCQ